MNHDKVDELSRRLEFLESHILHTANHSRSSSSKDRTEEVSSIEYIESINLAMRSRIQGIENENAKLLDKVARLEQQLKESQSAAEKLKRVEIENQMVKKQVARLERIVE